MNERRQHPRLTQPLEGTWRGRSGNASCRISDISWGGCFIQTYTAPSVSERTVITVTMPLHERAVEIAGVVLYVEAAMGFSVLFDRLTADQIDALTDVLGEPPESVLQENLHEPMSS
jgi:hypothetical protein